MLDENEPNAGAIGPDGETTEQTTVTRRRRAASRPAGPPPELPEQPVSAPATALAAQAAPSVTEGRSVPSTAAAQRAAGTPDEPPASRPVRPLQVRPDFRYVHRCGYARRCRCVRYVRH